MGQVCTETSHGGSGYDETGQCRDVCDSAGLGYHDMSWRAHDGDIHTKRADQRDYRDHKDIVFILFLVNELYFVLYRV